MGDTEFDFYVTPELKKYMGKYVAVVGGEVAASGINAKQVFEEASKKTGVNPVISKIPEEEDLRLLGPILKPVATITLENAGVEVAEQVYVDPSVRVTLIPKSVGDLLKLDLDDDDPVCEVKCLGRQAIPAVSKSVKISLDGASIDAKINWGLIEEVPMILGVDDFTLLCKG